MKIFKWIVLAALIPVAAHADTGITLHTGTSSYYQLFPNPATPPGTGYTMVMPPAVGNSGQTLAINSVTGSSVTMQFSDSGGSPIKTPVATGLGTSTQFTTLISSPTNILKFNSSQFVGSLSGSNTSFIGLNPSSVTLQGLVTIASLNGVTLSSFSATAPVFYNPATGVFSSNGVSLSTGVVGVLAVTKGGTGTATPNIVAGTNISSVTGTWPNQTINAATQSPLGSFSALQPVYYNNATGVFSVVGVSLSTGVVGTLPITSGGTGVTSATLTAGTNIASITGSWPNQTINALTQSPLGFFSALQPLYYNSGTGVFSENGVSLSTGVIGVLPVTHGGTGVASASIVAGTNIASVTGTWPNQTINAATQSPLGSFSATQPIFYNNTTGVFSSNGVSLSTGIAGTLTVAHGGTGTTTPSIVAGTNISSITGTWPNQTINALGGVPGSPLGSVQFNSTSNFAGDSAFTYDPAVGVTVSTITQGSIVMGSYFDPDPSFPLNVLKWAPTGDSFHLWQITNSIGNVLFNVDSAEERIGINTSAPRSALDVNGNLYTAGQGRLDSGLIANYQSFINGFDGNPFVLEVSSDGAGTAFGLIVSTWGPVGVMEHGLYPTHDFEVDNSTFYITQGKVGIGNLAVNSSVCTDGSSFLSTSGCTTPAAGHTTAVQYNNAGSFAGATDFTYSTSSGVAISSASIASFAFGGVGVSSSVVYMYAGLTPASTGMIFISSNTTLLMGNLAANSLTQANNNNTSFGNGGNLSAVTTANQVVAVGATALKALTAGSSATGIGYGACNTVTTGGTNTCIGELSGGPTTTASNIIIGAHAGTGNYGSYKGTQGTWIGNQSNSNGSLNITDSGCLGFDCVNNSSYTFVVGSTNTLDAVNLLSSSMTVYGGNMYIWTNPISSSSTYMLELSTTQPTVMYPLVTSKSFTMAISTNSHVLYNGPVPTVSSCGTTPSGSVVGTDSSGIITVGGTAPTACTLTFALNWGATPSCVFSDSSTTLPAAITSQSKTAVTLGFGTGGLAGGTVNYHCSCSGPGCI